MRGRSINYYQDAGFQLVDGKMREFGRMRSFEKRRK
jgi:hypothetical protein